MTTEQKNEINVERLSFGWRTTISVAINAIVGAFFLSQMQSSIAQLNIAVTDLKATVKELSIENKRYQTQNDADKATMNIRLSILENKMAMYHPEKQ